MDAESITTPSGDQASRQFFTYLLVHPCSPYHLSLATWILWETMMKALLKLRKVHPLPSLPLQSRSLVPPGGQAGWSGTFCAWKPMPAIPGHSPVLHDMDTESLRTSFIIFPGTGLSLTSWSFPRFSFLPFIF